MAAMLNCRAVQNRNVLFPCPFRWRHPWRTESFAMHQPAVNVMIKAARAGGTILLRHLTRLEAIEVVEKDRMDYASEIDGLAEAAIVKELRRAHPDYTVLGEEGGQQKGNRGASRFTWVIDPLDGTSNYLRGIPHWCVSIALCEAAEPVHAVIFDPLRNELFTASRGGGAQLNGHRIRVSERRELEGAMLATGFAPRERKRADAQLDCIKSLLVQAEDIRRAGSAALDLAYVAASRYDGYFEAGVKAWDIAAGILMVREAGGRVCDFRGAALGPMHVDSGSRQVVAANVRIIEPLQKTLVNTGYAKTFD
jgi:myo-inositol-1(or 4)-monophosphatase